jgi:legume-like lectin family protein/chitobiase/beta-hexosaminidase-like protein
MKRTDTRPFGIAVILFCTLSIALHAQVNVTTYHNDNARTGQNTQETLLTPANVNTSQFGKLFTVSVDGYVYAQPLYVANLTIAGGMHNVLYVATEHDSVYAIDADSGAVYWQQSFVQPAAGITTVPNGDVACSDLVPEIGITSTPVIDLGSKTIYVLAKTKENGTYVQRLHALDLVTHAEKFGGPVAIQATVSGTGDGSSGGQVTFDPLRQHNRPGLLLESGHIVIAWASHCDNGPYHGWVMSYSASTLAQEAVINLSPNGGQAGVWMSGDGLAADASGNLFFATGNGTYDGEDFGDSILKLGPPAGGSFSVLDWFTPYNQSSLNGGDTDLGSGGLLLFPDLPAGSAHQHLLVQMGKEGKMYLIDRDNMGKFCSTCTSSDTQIVQEIPGATAGIWGTPAYWNGSVYWAGAGDSGGSEPLKAFSFNANNSGLISTSPVSQTSKAFSFSVPSPSISASGNTNGILWGLDNSASTSTCSGGSNCQVLYAYDATNLENMLYNSSQAANNRDVPGGAVKFTTPTIANGKVYVGSQFAVSAYGKISTTPAATTPVFTPAPGSYTAPVQVTISDGVSGATIHCTTDGSTPTASSPVCSSVAISSTTTLKAIATASGYNPSDVAAGIYTIDPGATAINYGSGFTSGGLTFNGSAKLSGTRLRLTDGGSNEAGSAFISAPINIQTFTTDFGFQLSNASADGFTFTIQGVGATALGPAGGGLGYGPATTGGAGGIARSLAVKFDIYSNAGEGTDSTGLYTNGASPTVPALDMTSSGVTLLSGDVFNVHMTYDGRTLTMTITDATNSSQSFTASWPINIPSIVGSSTAYVGFTGGTGGLTAVQDILDWTYVTSQPTAASPTFAPPPGTYSSAQSVTLSDTTPGATIHCTTNGTAPTASSPVCTTLTVSTTTTIAAIAVASGYNNSTVASGTYTINTSGNPSVNYGSGFSSTGLALDGSTKLSGVRLRLTDGGTNEVGSGFYTTPLNIQSFTTDFSFQLTNPNADGFAFVLQNAGPAALGPGGGGLGYGPATPGQTPGIATSVAVKFDLYSNAGEGTNSTGLYSDGASPTVPATTLGGNVSLHSGDVFNVHVTYDGTTLSMTITDASTPADTFTTSWTVNIPNIVGAKTAYAGFTGGTGGLTATQDILTWTFTSGPPA